MSTAAIGARRQDVEIISLVGVIHGLSHFLQLALPSVFLAIRAEWGISFTVLGVSATVFYVVSGLAQTIAGFAVDRFGAIPVLVGGTALMSASVALMGVAPNVEVLIACAALGGLGNAVFHPADFAILNATVTPSRLGPAFSAHGLTGNIGWALAPPVITAFSGWFGGWRGALVAAGVLGFALLALLVTQRHRLRPRAPQAVAAGPKGTRAALAVLTSLPILMCFAFFVLFAAGLIGIQTFGIPTLNQTYHLSAELAAITLTAFLLAGGAGVLLGGVIAARTREHEHVAAVGISVASLLVALIVAFDLPGWAIVTLLAAAGFASGVTNPSRDLLVRQAAPPGATGRVYGFVYSGLDAGSAIAPLVFGALLDLQRGSLIVLAVAGLWIATVPTIYAMRRRATG
jgi:MFS family permease